MASARVNDGSLFWIRPNPTFKIPTWRTGFKFFTAGHIADREKESTIIKNGRECTDMGFG